VGPEGQSGGQREEGSQGRHMIDENTAAGAETDARKEKPEGREEVVRFCTARPVM
jgi:hypothetical protein